MNRPAVLKFGFLLVLMLLCATTSWAVVKLALPRSEWIEIGQLADFPPAEQPYEVYSPVHVFVVHANDQLLVLEPMNQVPRGVNVRWNQQEGKFIDPNRGSWFNLFGIPMRRLGYYLPVENQSLARYAMRVEDGKINIDLTQTSVVALSGGEQP